MEDIPWKILIFVLRFLIISLFASFISIYIYPDNTSACLSSTFLSGLIGAGIVAGIFYVLPESNN
jgi:hypothetical protein